MQSREASPLASAKTSILLIYTVYRPVDSRYLRLSDLYYQRRLVTEIFVGFTVHWHRGQDGRTINRSCGLKSGGGVCLHAAPDLCVSCSLEPCINPVMMALDADNLQPYISPGIGASLWYDLKGVVVRIPEIFAVPTPVTQGTQ